MNEARPFDVQEPNAQFVIIEMFGGDNNLSSFAEEDLKEMAAGNRGSIAVLALVDWADKPASVLEIPPAARRCASWKTLGRSTPAILKSSRLSSPAHC